MSGMQYAEDEDDLFDSADEDEEESETELSAEPQSEVRPRILQIAQKTVKSRRLRVRPMSPIMAQKHPEVISIMLTRADGRQLVFVRK